jgi:polysaccharide export outer membrane protein
MESVLKLNIDDQMPNYSTGELVQNRPFERTLSARWFTALATAACAVTLMLAVTACQTNKDTKMSNSEKDAISKATAATPTSSPTTDKATAATPTSSTTTNSDVLVLHEGDTLSVTFAGAPDLNTLAAIRRDGRITLKSLGEFKAAGLTPSEMEKELIKLYGAQLQNKEVSVAVQSSAFPVYVTGSVLRPGKILSDRPLTALEAIMEAGGPDYSKANLKSVRVLRTENGQTQHYIVNLKEVLRGPKGDQFHLKPEDILYVPEKFTMF